MIYESAQEIALQLPVCCSHYAQDGSVMYMRMCAIITEPDPVLIHM